MELMELPIEQVRPDPDNPRRALGDLEGLADSIRAHGLIQPVVVQRAGLGRFQLLAGHRRLEAAKLAGLETITAYCRDLDPTVVAIVENGHRTNLSPVEQAGAFAQLRAAGYTQKRIARITGYGEPHVSGRLALLDLDQETLERVHRGQLTAEAAVAAVRAVRAETAPASSEARRRRTAPAPHWVATHPLAPAAARICDDAKHRHSRHEMACGACWEAAIRADERGRAASGDRLIEAEPEPAPRRILRDADGADPFVASIRRYQEAIR